MEKKGEEKLCSVNPESEFKNNRICCLEVKKWTSVVGWIGLVFILGTGVAATVGAFAFGFDIFKLEESRALMTAGGAFEFCKVLWIFSFLGTLMHAELLFGNAMDERTSLLPWLTIAWALIFISVDTVAESVEPPSCETVIKLLVYWFTMGFALYVVHRRYHELSAWDRKLAGLEKYSEKYMEDEISV